MAGRNATLAWEICTVMLTLCPIELGFGLDPSDTVVAPLPTVSVYALDVLPAYAALPGQLVTSASR